MSDTNDLPKTPAQQAIEKAAARGTTTTALSTAVRGVGIEGLEDVPASIIPIPIVRLVQPTSTKVDLADGNEAPVGSFFFNDIKESVEFLEFVMLRAKHGVHTFTDKSGKEKKVTQLSILGVQKGTGKKFVLRLSIMSFTYFGQLIARMKKENVVRVWEYQYLLSSERQENDKGKFYVGKLELGARLEPEQIAKMNILYAQFQGVLDNADDEEETIQAPVARSASMQRATEGEVVDEADAAETVSPDDIPF